MNRAYGIVGEENRPDFYKNRQGAPFVLPDFTRTNNSGRKNGEKENLGFEKFIGFGQLDYFLGGLLLKI